MHCINRYSLTLIVAICSATAAVMPLDANDLSDLYKLAQTRDTALRAAKFQRDAAIEVRPRARAQWLPQVSATASLTTDLATGQGIGNLTGTNCSATTNGSSQTCTGLAQGLGLNLTQTLWDYQAFHQLKEANSQAASAEAAYRREEQNLLLRVAQAYFAILSAADQLATNQSAREAFHTLLQQAETREQAGVGPRSDVEQARSFYDATAEGVIDTQNALDDANLAMTVMVGAHAGHTAPLRSEIPLTPPEPAVVDEWVEVARKNNLDVRVAQLNLDAALRDISVQRGRALPTLSLVGSAFKLTQSQALGGNLSLNSVGVAINWPVFQGGAVASAVRQSRAQFGEAQAQYDATQRETERQTRAAFRGVVRGIDRIEAARRAVSSSKEAVEANRRNVEFGTGTEFDLLNAQNNYFAAQRAYSQSRYDFLTNLLILKRQAGSLSEHDLSEVDALLMEGK
jgi:outer membrane protein